MRNGTSTRLEEKKGGGDENFRNDTGTGTKHQKRGIICSRPEGKIFQHHKRNGRIGQKSNWRRGKIWGPTCCKTLTLGCKSDWDD